MLDHEEQFLFKEEILHLVQRALGDGGMLDNVEDLLTDVITSPRFDRRSSRSSAASRSCSARARARRSWAC